MFVCSFLCKNGLNLLNSFLLLQVCLSESLKDPLFILLQLSSFTIFLSNLDYLLLDNFVLVLTNLGPLLRCELVRLLSDFILLCLDLHLILDELLHVLSVLLPLSFEQFSHLLLQGLGLLLTLLA